MSDSEKTLTFLEHLEELRTRLIICIVAWIALTLASLPLAPKAISLLTRPLEAATQNGKAPRLTLQLIPADGANAYQVVGRFDNASSDTAQLQNLQVEIEFPDGRRRPIGEGAKTGSSFYYTKLIDPVLLIFKTALILGIILALPVWIYEIWAFVSPGLKASEKSVVRPLFLMCIVLFPIGVAFAYFMLQLIIGFLLSVNIPRLSPLLSYPQYAAFALRILGAFGLLFELPVVIMLLARLGVITTRQLREYRPYAYVVLAVLAMVITPPDPLSMLVALGPLYILYELSVILARLMERKTGELEAD